MSSSEIRVNTIKSKSGLSTITLSDTGNVISGITTVQGNFYVSSGSFNADITGNINSTGISTFSGGIELGTGTTISSPASDVFTVSTNGSERVRVSAGGSIGIGTNNPILGKCEIHCPGTTNHLILKDTTNNWISKVQVSTGGTFTIKSGDTEIFNLGSTGTLYKNGNQIYPILQVVSTGDITGAVDLGATTTSYTDIKTFATFTPKKSGSLVYVMLQVQTWWGSTANGNSADVYARIQQNSSGSYSTFYENNRLAGNFLYDERYSHDTKHMIGTFTTSSTNLTSLKLQAMYSGNNTNAFNFFHSSYGSSCLIIEFDVA